MRKRDSQRQRLYDAEVVLKGTGKPYKTPKAIKTRIERILKQKWTQRNFLGYPTEVIVRPGRGARWARFQQYRTFVFPKWAREEFVILHEMAHMLDDYRADNFINGNKFNKRPDREGHFHGSHDWRFAKTLLELVRHVMGKEAYEKLRDSFKTHKVKYREPRSPKAAKPQTYEQKIAARERARKARNARFGIYPPTGSGLTELETLLSF